MLVLVEGWKLVRDLGLVGECYCLGGGERVGSFGCILYVFDFIVLLFLL